MRANVLYQPPWDVADLKSHKEVSRIHVFDHAIVNSYLVPKPMRSCRFSPLRFHPEYFPAVTFAFLNTGVKFGSWILGMLGHKKKLKLLCFNHSFPWSNHQF